MFGADTHNRLNLFCRAGLDNCLGRDADGGEAVALPGLKLVGSGDEAGVRNAADFAV